MACLKPPQLAGLALGLAEHAHLSVHVEVCDACRTRLSAMTALTEKLSAIQSEMHCAHETTRARVLDSLPSFEMRTEPLGAWKKFALGFGGLTTTQRIAVGSIALSTVVGLALFLLAWNAAERLSAMERMLKAVREVKSFSYKLSENATISKEGMVRWWPNERVETPSLGRDHPTSYKRNDTTYWIAPGYLRADMKIVRFEGALPPGEHRQIIAHISTVYHPERPGVLVDHLTKTFRRLPEYGMRLEEFPEYSPIYQLGLIRKGLGQFERDLGRKEIEGKKARGYIVSLSYDNRVREFEVWLDAETDLPLEFGYTVKDEWRTTVYRVTDCRWNIELEPKLFETVPREGYTDSTPPREDAQEPKEKE